MGYLRFPPLFPESKQQIDFVLDHERFVATTPIAFHADQRTYASTTPPGSGAY